MIRSSLFIAFALLTLTQLGAHSQLSMDADQSIRYVGIEEDHLPAVIFNQGDGDVLSIILDSGISDFRLNIAPEIKLDDERRERILIKGKSNQVLVTRAEEQDSAVLQRIGADGAVSPSLLRGKYCMFLNFAQHTIRSQAMGKDGCTTNDSRQFEHAITSSVAFAFLEKSARNKELVVFFDTGAEFTIFPNRMLSPNMTVFARARIHTFDGVKHGVMAGPVTLTLNGVSVELDRALFSSSEIKNGADLVIGMDFMKERAMIVLDGHNGMQLFYNAH